jgi:four helix bundle protein
MRVAVSQSRIHVLIALGSLAEWGTYLTIANRLGFISRETFEEEMREADRLGHPEPRAPTRTV